MSEQEKQDKHEHIMSMQLIEEGCKIDIEQKIEHPPVAISYGHKEYKTKEGTKYFPIPIATYGNFSFVQAPPKSMKTFFVSLMASAYANTNGVYTGSLKSFRDDRELIHFDTEQGHWHSQRVFKRIKLMNEGIDLDFYHTFALRELSASTRVEFIEYYLDKIEEEGKRSGLVIIDGVADLVGNVNDIDECNDVIQKIMTWTVRYDCHILTIIHSNWGSEKPTGHLGSAMEKKAETQIKLTLDNLSNSVVANCLRSRNTPFDEFQFKLSGGLPEIFNKHSITYEEFSNF